MAEEREREWEWDIVWWFTWGRVWESREKKWCGPGSGHSSIPLYRHSRSPVLSSFSFSLCHWEMKKKQHTTAQVLVFLAAVLLCMIAGKLFSQKCPGHLEVVDLIFSLLDCPTYPHLLNKKERGCVPLDQDEQNVNNQRHCMPIYRVLTTLLFITHRSENIQGSKTMVNVTKQGMIMFGETEKTWEQGPR